MLIIKNLEEFLDVIFRIKSNGKSVGFVPTMGALHEGHLSLIKKAHDENEVVVCSIFVNPVQFNNASDLEKYPRTLEEDAELLKEYVDILFAPSEKEVFPEPPTEKYEFGALETVMEGKSRPGHFNGVAIIVKRLLNWVNPDKAYFGEKDYQQLAIIRQLVKDFKLNTQIVAAPIVREENGLAMSSRNRRLSPEEFAKAGEIYRILKQSAQISVTDIAAIKHFVISEMAHIPEFKLDYFEIVDAETLQSIDKYDSEINIIGCIALYIGEVRLIDNIKYDW